MDVTVRQSTAEDLPAIDRLISRSYPRLLKADYPPSVLVTAIPRIARAQPALVTSGTCFVAEDEDGAIVGAGGWTRRGPRGDRGEGGHIRHFATDVGAVRRGVGTAILSHVLADAAMRGVTRMACLSTRTAVPFYAALGFERMGEQEVMIELTEGIVFPAVSMARAL